MAAGAHNSYQHFRNKSWFYRNKRALSLFFNLISIIKPEQSKSIKANLILIAQANFIVFLYCFIFMAQTPKNSCDSV